LRWLQIDGEFEPADTVWTHCMLQSVSNAARPAPSRA